MSSHVLNFFHKTKKKKTLFHLCFKIYFTQNIYGRTWHRSVMSNPLCTFFGQKIITTWLSILSSIFFNCCLLGYSFFFLTSSARDDLHIITSTLYTQQLTFMKLLFHQF